LYGPVGAATVRDVSRERLFAAFFFVALGLLLYQVCLFLAPFFRPLSWAAILALTFYPLTAWLVRLFRGSRALAASVLVVGVLVVAVVPSIMLGSLLVSEAAGAYDRAKEMVQSGELTRLVDQMRTSRPGLLVDRMAAPVIDALNIDLSQLVLSATSYASQVIASQTGTFARNILESVVSAALMLLALFFFFRDGDRMSEVIRDLLPMDAEHKHVVFGRVYDTLTAVVQSMVVNAVAQGVLGGLGYWAIGGLPFSIFLGFLTAIASFLPPFGGAFVWVPAAIYLLVTGSIVRGVILALWGTLVISMVDNIIRPLFIGGRARLPTFLLLFAILGGMSVYGFLGIFLAPVILAALLSFIDIYREIYERPDLALVEPPPPPGRVAERR
jgi:predicted PurR-regulated permease PerM